MTVYTSSTTEQVASGRVIVGSIILVGGSANSSIILKDSVGSSGDAIVELKALANDSKVFTPLRAIEFTNGIYNTLSGTGAKVYIQVL
jgi:hypothetical protein